MKIQGAVITQKRQDQKRNYLQHIVTKTLNVQKKILKTSREKNQVTYKGTIRIIMIFLVEVLKLRRAWTDDLQMLLDHESSR